MKNMVLQHLILIDFYLKKTNIYIYIYYDHLY